MRLICGDTVFECDYAVKKTDSVELYDSNKELIRVIFNIIPSKWNEIQLEDGYWTPENEIPTETELLKADVDFLLMENDALIQENDQLRADVDFLLMLSEA